MLRFVPPAGTPLKASHILAAVRETFASNGSMEECLVSFAARFRVRHVVAACSGRAALWTILHALHRLRPNRSVVAVPAYTCFSVPAAVVRAGLQLYPVDIDPETLDYDFPQLEMLPEKELLCLLTSNLFGLVNDVPRIRQIAHAKAAFLIDDAAQALGATRNGCFAGTLGDVGFYSLARGKAMAAMEGGIIVTDLDEIATAVKAEAAALEAPSPVHSALLWSKMVTGAVFLNPWLYWIPHSLPFLKLGITEYSPYFPVKRLARAPRALLPELMAGLDDLNQIRLKNASALASIVAGNPVFATPKPGPNCQPIYIRFPLLASDENIRRQALDRLWRAGIGASPYYPSAICEIAGIERHMATRDFHCPQAEAVSRQLMTLPTHPLVRARDLERIASILSEVAVQARNQ